MIHVVTFENRELYSEQLAEMHQLRKTHFVEERGWSGLAVDEHGERDAYDDARTIYFFALDEDGRIGVSMRARPTTDKSMLGDVFPHLVPETAPVIAAEGVWEISRIFATRKFRTRRGVQRRSELFLATVETAVAKGVKRLVGMTDVYLLPQTLAAGWSVRPLGLPAAYGEGDVIAVEVDSSPEGLAAFQDRMGVRAPRALHVPADHPLTVLDPEEIEAVYALIADKGERGLRVLQAVCERVLMSEATQSEDQLEVALARIRAEGVQGPVPAHH